jgi:hypothetical protein
MVKFFLENLYIDHNTTIVGDFNAPNTQWGYSHTTTIGSMVEDFAASLPLQLIQPTNKNKSTFTHHSGSQTRPDLVFAHTKIADEITQRNIPSPSGGDHKIIILDRQQESNNSHLNGMCWNFKKANWPKYKQELETQLQGDVIDDNVDISSERINSAIIQATEKHIPRGKVKIKNYKPYWNTKQDHLVKEKNKSFHEMEIETDPEEKKKKMIEVRQLQAVFKKEISSSQRSTFNKYLQGINYKTDGAKAHKFFSKVRGRGAGKPVARNEPLIYKNKKHTQDKEKAKAFSKHFAKVSNKAWKKTKKQKLKYIESEDPYNAPFTIKELNVAIKN